MGLRIQNNIAALNAHRQLKIADVGLAKALERLSSGFRINKAADDAAGLSVSMKFRAQIRSLQQGSRNASEATALLQVAEGAADQIASMLQRMKELATQAASANTTSTDRANISTEVNTLESEIDRIANSTKYGSQTLINGSFGTTSVSSYGALAVAQNVNSVDVSNAAGSTTFTVAITTSGTNKIMTIDDGTTTQSLTTADGTIAEGSTSTLNFSNLGISVVVNSAYDANANLTTGTMATGALGNSQFQVGNEDGADFRISFTLGNFTSGASGLNVDVDVSSQSGAQSALTSIDNAFNSLANNRSTIGVAQNRLGFASANIASSIENLSAAESVIRDADMAFETIAFTKNQILIQAGTAMLGQANLAPQSLLSLLS